jgi:Family of unknown function (DUF5715)
MSHWALLCSNSQKITEDFTFSAPNHCITEYVHYNEPSCSFIFFPLYGGFTEPMRSAVIILLLSALGVPAMAMSARNVPRRTQVRKLSHSTRHHRARFRHIRFRGFAIIPALRGSRDSLLKQNEEIDRAGLPRIQDDEQLEQLKAVGYLVHVKESRLLRFDPQLAEDRHYCRPWTLAFLEDLSRDYYDKFKTPIQVNSAVRTVEQQRKLRRHNGNAAPETGETASSHLAGVTVDIGKRGMTRKQHKWVADYLSKLKADGVVEPEEERRQPVFHVMVTDRYLSYSGRETGPAPMKAQIELPDIPIPSPILASDAAPATSQEAPSQGPSVETPKN